MKVRQNYLGRTTQNTTLRIYLFFLKCVLQEHHNLSLFGWHHDLTMIEGKMNFQVCQNCPGYCEIFMAVLNKNRKDQSLNTLYFSIPLTSLKIRCHFTTNEHIHCEIQKGSHTFSCHNVSSQLKIQVCFLKDVKDTLHSEQS